MNKLLKSNILFLLSLIGCGFLNYHPQLLFGWNSPHWGWLFSLLSSFLILRFISKRYPKQWKQKLGIDFKRSDKLNFIIVTLTLLLLSYFLVGYLSNISGYDFKFRLFHYKEYYGSDYPFHYILASYLYYIPETFNEEMLIGALLLFGIERKFSKLNKNYMVVIVALIFSLMHQAMYKWSPVQSGILLTWTTIASLFFIGVLRNSLILKTRNIALSWAIHLSFNLIFFSGFFINIKTQEFPSEPEIFNIVFGNIPMFLITGVSALISIVWMNKDIVKKMLIKNE